MVGCSDWQSADLADVYWLSFVELEFVDWRLRPVMVAVEEHRLLVEIVDGKMVRSGFAAKVEFVAWQWSKFVKERGWAWVALVVGYL